MFLDDAIPIVQTYIFAGLRLGEVDGRGSIDCLPLCMKVRKKLVCCFTADVGGGMCCYIFTLRLAYITVSYDSPEREGGGGGLNAPEVKSEQSQQREEEKCPLPARLRTDTPLAEMWGGHLLPLLGRTEFEDWLVKTRHRQVSMRGLPRSASMPNYWTCHRCWRD